MNVEEIASDRTPKAEAEAGNVLSNLPNLARLDVLALFWNSLAEAK